MMGGITQPSHLFLPLETQSVNDESELISGAYDPTFRSAREIYQKVLSSIDATRNGDLHLFSRPPRPMARLGLEPDQQGMRVLGLYVLEGSGMFEGV